LEPSIPHSHEIWMDRDEIRPRGEMRERGEATGEREAAGQRGKG
jgi:hypothetical protein